MLQQGAARQDTTRAGQVYDPDRAGRAQAPVTAADNDQSVQALEKKLRCSCGCGLDIYTCRTTDFTCTYSPALHKHVLGMLKAQSGSVSVFGLDPVQNPVGTLGRIGYLSEDRDLPNWMRVGELMRYTQAFFPTWEASSGPSTPLTCWATANPTVPGPPTPPSGDMPIAWHSY